MKSDKGVQGVSGKWIMYSFSVLWSRKVCTKGWSVHFNYALYLLGSLSFFVFPSSLLGDRRYYIASEILIGSVHF